MNHDPREPLTDEERVLAARLPRTSGRSEPGAGIDARILAAARAAMAAPVQHSRPSRRWQIPAALAATLCLAVGLSWQLRNAPTRHARIDAATPAAIRGEPHAPPSVNAAPASGQASENLRQDAALAPPPEQASPMAAGSGAVEAPEAAAPTPSPALSGENAPPLPPPPVSAFPAESTARPAVVDEARPIEPIPGERRSRAERALDAPQGGAAMKATAPPPPAPKPLLQPAPAPAPAPVAAPPASMQRSGAAAPARAASAADAVEVDEPPATMNSPSARKAWLRRISELVHAGRNEEARASLAEFRRRYPNERIPAELKVLETSTDP